MIRTADDLSKARALSPPRIAVIDPATFPVPNPMIGAATTSMISGEPVTLTCAGKTWSVTPEQARKMWEWIGEEVIRRKTAACTAAARRPGRPADDWLGFLYDLMQRMREYGESLDAALSALCHENKFHSLAAAHRRIKEQRQASAARLRELGGGSVARDGRDGERFFHRAVLDAFPPRRPPGRPPRRKSGRKPPR